MDQMLLVSILVCLVLGAIQTNAQTVAPTTVTTLKCSGFDKTLEPVAIDSGLAVRGVTINSFKLRLGDYSEPIVLDIVKPIDASSPLFQTSGSISTSISSCELRQTSTVSPKESSMNIVTKLTELNLIAAKVILESSSTMVAGYDQITLKAKNIEHSTDGGRTFVIYKGIS